MSKHIVSLTVFWLFLNSSSAQLHDKHWYTGYDSDVGFSTNFNYWFGVTKFSFTPNDTPVITRDSLGINFDRCNITMSDSAGNVLFYTNGVTFRNAQDQVMQNGDSLGWGWYFKNYDPSSLRLGRRTQRGSVCLPTADNNIFHYLYSFLDSAAPPSYLQYKKVYLSAIDVTSDRLLFKDSTIADAVHSPSFASVKGDKNEWWTCLPLLNKPCLLLIHIDSLSNITTQELCIGAITQSDDLIVSAIFTNDGTKYVTASSAYSMNQASGIQVFDFDRCSGSLQLKETFRIKEMTDSLWAPWGIANSPNSRYLYLFCSAAILQFDLEAANIENSMVKVAQWDGFTDYVPVTMYQGQLALDGKIYVSSGNGVTYIGVIENPDVGGIGCNVKQHSIRVPTFITGLNHFPNYRLGAANCTGVGINEAAVSKVRMGLYPNPANTTLQVEYNYINWEQCGGIQLILTDATGRSIHSQTLPMYSGLQNIDVSQFAGGVYFVSLSAKGRIVANGRFVKE